MFTRLTRCYWWCVMFHWRYHAECGAGAFSCSRCHSDPPPHVPGAAVGSDEREV